VSNPVARISDWIETASGATVPIKTGYSFDGALIPTHDFTNTFGALLTSSATGKLQIEGRKNGGAGISIFVNALRLVAQPVIRITKVELVGGNIRLTIETQYPDQPIRIEEKNDLNNPTWNAPASGGVTQVNGPIVTAEFPASAAQTFYRVVSP
ncbi:MAG: hypothetical protein ACR2H1_11005, partial [Limisphaerales bacterium]